MKLSRTTWIALAVGLFVIASIGLYMVYQGQASERQEAEDRLAQARAEVPLLLSQKMALEAELSQMESDLAQWQSQIAQLELELSQTISELGQILTRFPGLIESIEYDEMLFAFARENNLKITSLAATESADEEIEGVTYSTTSFVLSMQGEVADILDFVNTIVTDNDFRTAVMEPATIAVPKPLTELEKEGMTEEEIREKEMPSTTLTFVIYTYQGE